MIVRNNLKVEFLVYVIDSIYAVKFALVLLFYADTFVSLSASSSSVFVRGVRQLHQYQFRV